MYENNIGRNYDIYGLLGFIFSLAAISFGIEFSIASIILCSISLKRVPDYGLAKAGRIIAVISIVIWFFLMIFILSKFSNARSFMR